MAGFLVVERFRDGNGSHNCYLGRIDIASSSWSWSRDGRDGAARFRTRAEAEEAAASWESAIRAAGYTPRTIVVVPAGPEPAGEHPLVADGPIKRGGPSR
jgi:hypothetical protein